MTLFRLADFTCVSRRVLCFADELRASGQLSEPQLAHYAGGSGCALILELRHTFTGKSVIIANASIDSAAADQNPDIQCLQIALLYRCIQLHTSAGLQPPRASAVLIACNMNSQPHEDAFQFATDGYAAGSLPSRCTRPRPSLQSHVSALRPESFHQSTSACRLAMRSVYQAVDGANPLVTQASGPKEEIGAFYGCADYILCAQNRGLAPVPRSTMPTPSLASVQCDGGCLPNAVFPSEHIPLGAHFQFSP
jgi:mRNA deadenylase 3'-5' endonuclease subunit Ccr4